MKLENGHSSPLTRNQYSQIEFQILKFLNLKFITTLSHSTLLSHLELRPTHHL